MQIMCVRKYIHYSVTESRNNPCKPSDQEKGFADSVDPDEMAQKEPFH